MDISLQEDNARFFCLSLRQCKVPSSLLSPAVLTLWFVLHHHYFFILTPQLFPHSQVPSRSWGRAVQAVPEGKWTLKDFSISFSPFVLYAFSLAPLLLWWLLTVKNLQKDFSFLVWAARLSFMTERNHCFRMYLMYVYLSVCMCMHETCGCLCEKLHKKWAPGNCLSECLSACLSTI